MRFIRHDKNKKQMLEEAHEHVDVIKLFEPFKDKKIVWLSLSESLDIFLNKGYDIDIKLDEDEYLFLSSCREIDYMQRTEKKLIENLWKNDIDIDKVFVINSNPLSNTAKIKYIYWEYFETAVRQLEHKEIKISDKKHEKKFLCLNRMLKPHQSHKRKIMYEARSNQILKFFNASLWDENLPLRYDTDDKDTNWWFSIKEQFSYENDIWVVTESLFDDDDKLPFLSEKVFKPILLKMPFIIVGQPYTLKRLQRLGYKTFNHVWKEDYDNVLNPNTRMMMLSSLLKSLSKQDTKQIIEENADILEYNYNNLMNRRPEQNLLDTINDLP